MESTPDSIDGVEEIHAAEKAARERIEEAEKQARIMREDADKESKSIIHEAEESAKRESTRILEGITGEASKVDRKIQNATETDITKMLEASEQRKKDAVKRAVKILLEE